MAANASNFDAQKVCLGFKVLIKGLTAVENNISAISDHFASTSGSETEKRSSADQAFREILIEKLTVDKDSSVCDALVHNAINCSNEGITSVSLPITLMSDMFDCITLDVCEELFHIVEKHVATWTSEPFFTAGKNLLLRMCNDLLRRLSTSQNTVFCGRIQLILTRLFPLSEKSGLNLMSQFNVENVTAFDYKGSSITKEKGSSKKEVNTSEVVDYVLYTKFWSLQDFFRSPTQCYHELHWKKFVDNASAVLAAFSSHKLEHVSKKRKSRENKDVVMSDGTDQHTYFAKFLTSEKLLNLQLNDSNFRRTILVQLLILFQYLTGEVKFKSASQKLKEKQSLFVKDTTSKVYELLKETPPDGEKFAKYVEGALNREENWISWKNAGCPSFLKEREEATTETTKTSRKRKATESHTKMTASKIDMGSTELTRLWNLCPDNMTACKSETRNFLPDLKEYFEEAIDQADPESQIEEQYKLVNDPKFGWRALRLLSRQSQHFFQSSANPFKTLPQYLDIAIQQLGQELMPSKVEETIVENGTSSEEKENSDTKPQASVKQEKVAE